MGSASSIAHWLKVGGSPWRNGCWNQEKENVGQAKPTTTIIIILVEPSPQPTCVGLSGRMHAKGAVENQLFQKILRLVFSLMVPSFLILKFHLLWVIKYF